MKIFGWLLFAIGVLVTIVGLNLDTTVGPSVSEILAGDAGRTHNLGLLQNRELTVHIGLATLIVGSIFAGLGSVIDVLLAGASRQSGSAVDYTESASPSAEATPESAAPELEAISDEQLMEEYGITYDGEQYRFMSYRYDRLADAVRFAKSNQWMRANNG